MPKPLRRIELRRRAASVETVQDFWRAGKGPDSIMPPPVRAAFVLPHQDADDDQEDEHDCEIATS
jgi:hypothetical protein